MIDCPRTWRWYLFDEIGVWLDREREPEVISFVMVIHWLAWVERGCPVIRVAAVENGVFTLEEDDP